MPRTKSHGMSEGLGQAILAANAAGIHVAMVDGDDVSFTHLDTVRHHATPEEAEQLLMHIADGGVIGGIHDPRLTIVCCTDGKQDPCCARYGFATWKALRQAADPNRFRVLQSTHLGGCRFAASLVVLPQRARYSRLEPFQVGDFLNCLEQGIPYLPAYRGNPSYDAPAQTAEIALLEWAGQRGITGAATLHKTESDISNPDKVHIHATIGTQHTTITIERRELEVSTRCVTIGEPEGTKNVARWIATSVQATD
ncbi:sucrase ferredoxin [Agrobacterium tumefaciens]|uniref:sucrase ferredoxin n=2 Tax=Rhizobiaceae TaxID=82115 RepID=UPI001FCD3E39|nr:sucrase ferredoxin [Agrobacterium tumefaciens]